MNELKSYTEYAVSTPTADFVIGFDFNYGEDAVNVTVDNVPATEAGYSVVYLNETTVRLSPSVPSGVVRLQRETDIDQTDHAYRAGAKFIAQTMDENFEQLRHSQQEVRDGFGKLQDDTYAIIDTLEVVVQSAQEAADDANAAAQVANDAAAQVADKVSQEELDDVVSPLERYTPLPYKVQNYAIGQRVTLDTGEVVENLVYNNSVNPNTDMLGWVKVNSANQIIDLSGKTQQQLNTVFTGKRWFAPLYGVKSDGVTDDSNALNSIITQMQDGDILEVLPRNHRINSPIIVNKAVLVTSGSMRHQTQAGLFTCSGSGVVFRSPWAKWQSISLTGTQTSTVLDPKNNVFGNIGFKHEYSGVGTSSGVVTEDCFVTYFDTNIVEYAEGVGTWAGAYRDYVRVFSRYGRIGYASVNGGTFNNWFGGAIQFCSEWGVYSDASQKEYNNTSFHGTAIEKNGKKYSDGDYTLTEVLKTGIYCGKNAKVFLHGSYSEDTTFYADDGGRIFCFGTHQQLSNSRFFSADAPIEDHGGFGAHKNTVNFKERYATFFTTLTNATAISVSQSRKTVRIQSSTNGAVSVGSRSIRLDSINAKDLQAVKLAFSYRFASGQASNSDLLINPVLRITSATASRSDSSRSNANFPLSILKRADGNWHNFEFIWIPRKQDEYIDPTAMLASISLTLNVQNGLANPNFSTTALDLYIDNIDISVFCNVYSALESDIVHSGSTANRPSNLGTTEVGTLYYDTTEARNYVWTGSSWVRQKATGDDAFASYSTTQLQDATHSVNTTYKLNSNFVFNNTNGKMYFRTGTTPTSVWRATDASGDITPV